MANVREVGVRISYAAQFFLLLVIGLILGWMFGGIFTEFLFYLLVKKMPQDWTIWIFKELGQVNVITESAISKTLATIQLLGSLAFSTLIAGALLQGREHFANILRIKLVHRMVYYTIRGIVYEEINTFEDYSWAIIYCLSQSLIPIGAALIVFFPIINAVDIDFIAVCSIASVVSALAYEKAEAFVYLLLYPYRLEREIQDVPHVMAVLIEQMAEKERLAAKQNKPQ